MRKLIQTNLNDQPLRFLFVQGLLLSIIIQTYRNNAAELTFQPSPTNVADEYCVDEFYWHNNTLTDVSSYCDDIDNVLINYCGNVSFFEIIDPTYYPLPYPTADSCTFFLEDGQIIDKTYILSHNITINHIKFSSKNHLLNHENETNIILSRTFLSISSYEGLVKIVNIYFSSDGTVFSLIDVVAIDIELDIVMDGCQFSNINGINGAIINMANNNMNNGYTKGINVTFESCKIENVFAEYGAILYIERNNVYVTFSASNITNIASSALGSAVHWICQKRLNGVELCGDLLITDSYVYGADTNIFTIDLSFDPSQTYFILEVDTSTFTDINGTIFNFNRNDDLLGPSAMRIQQQNAFINIRHSHFEDNGLKIGDAKLWYPAQDKFVTLQSYTHNGTIFTINSITLPNITIENSNFTHNAGLYGTIFYWYCSRRVQLITDTHCGSISLQNNLFYNNMIGANPSKVGVRSGSLLYSQMRESMEFELLIEDCHFIQQFGNCIHFEKSTAAIPMIDGTFYSNISNTSNWTNSSMIYMDIESMILIQGCTFMDCTETQDTKAETNFATILTITGLDMVYTFITDSVFDGNLRTHTGSSVFSADYAPIIKVTRSNFTNNRATGLGHGIFNLVKEDVAMIEISDSKFESNYAYSTIISTGDNIYVSLNITTSSFINNINKKTGCFNIYSGDINIVDSEFHANTCDYFCVVILNLVDGGHLHIESTSFTENREIPKASPTSGAKGLFNINNANVTATNVNFTNNILWNNGIYVTMGSIELFNNRYIGNTVPKIVDGNTSAINVNIEECIFIDNTITGMMMIDARDITVLYSEFVNNTGEGQGSLPRYDAGDFTLSLMYSNFIQNTGAQCIMIDKNNVNGTYGGVVFVTGSNSRIEVDHCTFDGNAVSGFGGGIYINDSYAINNCNMSDNEADSGGFLFGIGIILFTTSDLSTTSVDLSTTDLSTTDLSTTDLSTTDLSTTVSTETIIVESTAESDPDPTAEPTAHPTADPTAEPTAHPTADPTAEPTAHPTADPTTADPTADPTADTFDGSSTKSRYIFAVCVLFAFLHY